MVGASPGEVSFSFLCWGERGGKVERGVTIEE